VVISSRLVLVQVVWLPACMHASLHGPVFCRSCHIIHPTTSVSCHQHSSCYHTMLV
jgi:hypothetical protein